MKYDLIKVTQEKYAIDILKGNLYMNPLSFFRKYENDYMDDITEGACGDIPKNQMRQYGYYFPDDIIESMVYDNVLMLSDYFANCKYLLKIIEFIKDEPRVSIKSPALKDIVYKSFEDEDKDDMGMLMIKVLAMELEVTLEHKRKNLEMADID